MPPPRPGTKVFSLAATTAILRLSYHKLVTGPSSSVTVRCKLKATGWCTILYSSSGYNTSCFHPRTWFYIGLWLREPEPLSGVATQTPAPALATGLILLHPLLSVAILTGRWKNVSFIRQIPSLYSFFLLRLNLHPKNYILTFDSIYLRAFSPPQAKIDWYW